MPPKESPSQRKKGGVATADVATQVLSLAEELFTSAGAKVRRAFLKGGREDERLKRIRLEGKRDLLRRELKRLWEEEANKSTDLVTPSRNTTSAKKDIERLLDVEEELLVIKFPDPREYRRQLKTLEFIKSSEEAPWEELRKKRQERQAERYLAFSDRVAEEQGDKDKSSTGKRQAREASPEDRVDRSVKRSGQDLRESLKRTAPEPPPPHPYAGHAHQGFQPVGPSPFGPPFAFPPFVPTPHAGCLPPVNFTSFLAGPPASVQLRQSGLWTQHGRIKATAQDTTSPGFQRLARAPSPSKESTSKAAESPRSPSGSPPTPAQATPSAGGAGEQRKGDNQEGGDRVSPLPRGSLLESLPVGDL